MVVEQWHRGLMCQGYKLDGAKCHALAARGHLYCGHHQDQAGVGHWVPPSDREDQPVPMHVGQVTF